MSTQKGLSTPPAKSKPTEAHVETDSELYLPQYGFGSTYRFNDLVEHNRFLFRVYTPHASQSRAPSPRPSSPVHHSTLSRSPSSLSASKSSIRSGRSGHGSQDEDATSADPYFISRRFKGDLGSPDAGVRQRTLSTLSTLSGGTYIGSDYDESDSETAVSNLGLSRSTSMSRVPSIARFRTDSFRPMHQRSQSAEVTSSSSPPPPQAGSGGGADMTYEDLVRHLDWTTRSTSPYVTTSFSFFWCLWEAVRRYKLAVKHDVEIAVIDARKVVGRAKTALEVLRGVESGKQDKSYWKWYRFALESQDVLVFGAIPGDAIFASVPLTQILPKLPTYFFKDDPSILKAIDAPLAAGEEDPRSPSPSRRPRSPPNTNSPSAHPSSVHQHEHHHQHQHHHLHHQHSHPGREERTFTPQLLASLAWDVGTSLKPSKHARRASTQTQLSSSMYTSPPTKKTHTSHREFCAALTAAFLSPTRDHAAKLLDATTGAVRLAECLIEPWFRAQCAQGSGYPFRDHDHDHDESDSERERETHSCGNPECIGLKGDGCALKTKSGFVERSYEDEAKSEAANTLQDLALYVARWPAGWWYAEHAGEVEGIVSSVVDVCVREAALGVGARVERELQRIHDKSLATTTKEAHHDERRGRGEKRDSGVKSKGKYVDGSPMPWPVKGTPLGTPNKPRARSPLGVGVVDPGTPPSPSPQPLAPAIELKSKAEMEKERERSSKGVREESDGDGESVSSSKSARRPPASVTLGHAQSTPGSVGTGAGTGHRIKWSDTLSTPPPTPPRRTASGGRRSPPPPPPPRTRKRLSFPGSWTSAAKATSSTSGSGSVTTTPLLTPGTSPAASLRTQESESPSNANGNVKAGFVAGGAGVHVSDGLPGGWPGSDSEAEAEEDEHHTDDRGDVIVRRPGRRPMSWAGSALGTLGALGLGVAFADKEKDKDGNKKKSGGGGGGVDEQAQPRARTRTLSHSALKESALQEMVENVLRASASSSSLRDERARGRGDSLKGENANPPPPMVAAATAVDEELERIDEVKSRAPERLDEVKPRGETSSLERRLSSSSLDRRSELSPVREEPGEDEEEKEKETKALTGMGVEVEVEVAAEAEVQAEANTDRDANASTVQEPSSSVNDEREQIEITVIPPVEDEDSKKDIMEVPSLDLTLAPITTATTTATTTEPSPAPELEPAPALQEESTSIPPPSETDAKKPLSSPKHERSRTLESIPEEDKEELSVTVPVEEPKAADGSDKPEPGVIESPIEVKEEQETNLPAVLTDSGVYFPPEEEVESAKGLQTVPESMAALVSAAALKRDASVWTQEGSETEDLENAVTDILKPEKSPLTESEEQAIIRAQNEKLYNVLLPHAQEKEKEKSELPPSEDATPAPALSAKDAKDTLTLNPSASSLSLTRPFPRFPPLARTTWLRRRLSHLSSAMSFSLTGSVLSPSSPSSSASDMSPIFEDDTDSSGFSILRASGWAASCFVCGVLVTAFIVADRRQSVMIGNRYC